MSTLPAAVLWDMDGTLVDTEPYWMECEHELVALLRRRVDRGRRHVDRRVRPVDAAVVHPRARRRADSSRRRSSSTCRRRASPASAATCRGGPARGGCSTSLNAPGVPCALVTMSWRDIANEVVAAPPAAHFQAVITGDMVANGKPHPEPYRRAAAALGVDPVSCVAIEDSPTGARSAEAAGCVVVAVPNHVPIDPAPGRVLRRTLVGLTPELLGEIIETTPLPPTGAPVTAGTGRRDDRPRRGGGLALWWQRVLGGGWRSLGALATVLVLIGVGVWWFAIRDTTPPYRPGAFNVHTWVPYWMLDDATPALDEQANVFHQVSPFWYHTYGLDTFEFDRNAGAEVQQQAADFIADARRRGVPIVTSLYDSTDSGAMAGDPRRPGDAGRSTSTRSPTSPPCTTSRASTSTTRSSPSTTTAAPGRRRGPTGWRSSASSARGCTPTGAS